MLGAGQTLTGNERFARCRKPSTTMRAHVAAKENPKMVDQGM